MARTLRGEEGGKRRNPSPRCGLAPGPTCSRSVKNGTSQFSFSFPSPHPTPPHPHRHSCEVLLLFEYLFAHDTKKRGSSLAQVKTALLVSDKHTTQNTHADRGGVLPPSASDALVSLGRPSATTSSKVFYSTCVAVVRPFGGFGVLLSAIF